MKLMLAAAAGLACAVAYPAAAMTVGPESQEGSREKAEAETDEEDPNRIICKRKRQLVFGSHRRAKRQCHTAAQWKEMETHARRELQHQEDRSLDPGRADSGR